MLDHLLQNTRNSEPSSTVLCTFRLKPPPIPLRFLFSSASVLVQFLFSSILHFSINPLVPSYVFWPRMACEMVIGRTYEPLKWFHKLLQGKDPLNNTQKQDHSLDTALDSWDGSHRDNFWRKSRDYVSCRVTVLVFFLGCRCLNQYDIAYGFLRHHPMIQKWF